jgi:hypothetical protein
MADREGEFYLYGSRKGLVPLEAAAGIASLPLECELNFEGLLNCRNVDENENTDQL